jgi:predicted amidophosphoribosyltransferase
MEPLAEERCVVCDLPRQSGEVRCGNPLCNRSDRYFTWNYAIAMRSGELEQAINRYKYQRRHGWALVFGRVLIGFLEENAEVLRQFDVITASPTYTGPGGRDFDHTRLVLVKAAAEEWPGGGVALRHHKRAADREDRGDAVDGGAQRQRPARDCPGTDPGGAAGNPA